MKKSIVIPLLTALALLFATPLVACADNGVVTIKNATTTTTSTTVPFVTRTTHEVLNGDPSVRETVSMMCYKGDTWQLVVAGKDHMPSINRPWTATELDVALRASRHPNFGKPCSKRWQVASDSEGDIYIAN